MQDSLALEIAAAVVLVLSGWGWYKLLIGGNSKEKQINLSETTTAQHDRQNIVEKARLLANSAYLTKCVRSSTNSQFALRNRVVAMDLLILSGAGKLLEQIRNFGWDSEIGLQMSKFDIDTDVELGTTDDIVILFESYLWIYFIIERLWENDPGSLSLGNVTNTMPHVSGFAQEMFGGLTDDQFATYLDNRMTTYQKALGEGCLEEAFTEIIILSEGRRRLADPLLNYNHVRAFTLDTLPLTLNIRIFFSGIPSSHYNAFKNFQKLRPECFLH